MTRQQRSETCYNSTMQMKTAFSRAIVATLVILGSVSYAFSGEKDAAPLTVVDSEYVCMVNDASYDRPQVEVEVDGKTYFGCCEMCKARLEQHEQLRVAIDPVTGNEVDKAEAVIAADAYNRVFYFESEETLNKANRKLTEKK